ncbi:MAG: RNA-binding S4 domain-containing protein [Eubacterium sp.]|nr:RNA-binding S4 domain-containing protein [Clostridia bacterium]MBO5486256.1 RNA-binding S4 domain-containing protein [Eubacterium sp.]
MEKITFILRDEFITLQNLLKAENIVATGGEAKYVIVDGLVTVNGECETRRGKKLRSGDVVVFENYEITVQS